MQNNATVADILRTIYPDAESGDPSKCFGQVGHVYDGLSHAWLFWPKLMEVHGAVFVAAYGWDEAWLRERITTPANPEHENWPELSWKEAVDSFNRIEVGDLFQWWPEPLDPIAAALEQLTEILVQAWDARLRTAYPERVFR